MYYLQRCKDKWKITICTTDIVASMVILVNGKQHSFCDMLQQTEYHCIAYTVDGCIRMVHQDGSSNLVYRIKITWWQYFVLVADVSDGRVCGCVAVPREVVWNLYKPLLLLPVATRPTYVQLNVNVITDSEQVTSFLNTCRKLKATHWLPLYIDIMLSYSCPFMGNGNGIT